jgi:uncharacterized protein YecE (DUF72 family)
MAGVVYYRLHGSPRVYYSAYDKSYLDRLSARLRAHAQRRYDHVLHLRQHGPWRGSFERLDVHAAVGS